MANIVEFSATGSSRDRSPQRALIIEDDATSFEFLREYLQNLGFQAVGTEISEHAIDRALETLTERDLVVVDIILGPELDGFDVIRKLASIEFRGQVLFVSAYRKDYLHLVHSLAVALRLRVAGALSKPVSPPELESCVA